MKSQFLKRVLVAALTLSSGAALITEAQAQTPTTTFSCGTDSTTGLLATIAQRGPNTATLITWSDQTEYFGDRYTPNKRCSIVTSKLNSAVSANGGSLRNLMLTNGSVNGEEVICVLNGSSATECNSSNVLFTLKPENARRSGQILGQLLQIGRGNVAGNVIRESSGGQVYVNLADWQTNAMGASGGSEPASAPASGGGGF